MDLRVLNYFLMAAREENITKAAQLLHITQPTLSRQLRQLEQELGVDLFQRSNHSIYLTDAGMLFRRRAQELVDLADKAKKEVHQPDEMLTGEIGIGCGELNSMAELSEMMTAFLKEQPLVKFELRSGNNIDIKSWLERGVLDLGLMIEPVDVGKYDYRRMQKKERWGILAHRDSEFADRDSIKPGDLAGIPLITVGNELVHNELANWSGDYAVQMTPIVHYNLLNNAATMVQQKAGIAVCLKLNCQYEDLCFVPFEPELTLGSVLAWKDQQPYARATAAFIRFIKKYKK